MADSFFTQARAAFDRYLGQYDMGIEKIRLKYIHTEGVIRCMDDICTRMGLSNEDKCLAGIIALLHDIGRFEQARLYNSFEPTVMDHASYGVDILFGREKMIRQFLPDDKWDPIIRDAILYHSDFALKDDLDERSLLFARLIRDADKLDNCRVKLEESIEILLGCSPQEAGSQTISPEVWQECLAASSIHSSNRKTKIDYWVSYIAYFFDINFPQTAQIILENDYVSQIIDRIPYSNQDTQNKMLALKAHILQHLTQIGIGFPVIPQPKPEGKCI